MVAAAFTAARLWGLSLTDGRPTTWGVNAIPLNGKWDWNTSWWLAVPAAAAFVGLLLLRLVANRRFVLVVAAVAMVASGWNAALHLAAGPAGLDDSIGSPWDYLAGVPAVGDSPGAYLRDYVADLADQPTHVRSHPPGMVVALWGLSRAGVEGMAGIFALVLAGTALAAAAVLVAARELGGETMARRAAPFVALAPGLVFALNADIVFAGVWAAAVAALAVGLARDRRVLTLAAGAGLGIGLLLSYGLLVAGALPAAVVIAEFVRRTPSATIRGSRRTLVTGTALALAAMVTVVALPAAWGFHWFDGLDATRAEYAKGIATVRQYRYFVGANLTVAAFTVGPAVCAALALGPRRWGRAGWLIGAAVLALVTASVSGLSKAEVERIWLPMLVWVPLAAAALPRWRGWALAAQVAMALVLVAILETPW